MATRVTVIYDGTTYTLRWLKGLFAARDALRELGVLLEISSRKTMVSRSFSEADIRKLCANREFDVVFLAFHSFSIFERGGVRDMLSSLREKSNKIIWLDTADSTGTCRFEVMPYVDRYLKKQLLKDVGRYCEPMWGGRTYCQYYHEELSLEDEFVGATVRLPLSKVDIPKLGLSWNVGLGDLFGKSRIRHLFLSSRPLPVFKDAWAEKRYDMHYRGSSYSPVAGYQRARCAELISNQKILECPDPKERVPKHEYNEELASTRTVLSPFGWGEICGRDFEAFANGAALIKPDMSHLTTYPECFLENETYLPLKWDFSDFGEMLERVRADEGGVREVAEAGQGLFRRHLSDAGKMEFAEHLVSETHLFE